MFAFNPALRYERQEHYDIGDYETVPFEFEKAGQKSVYKNFNLSIFTDDYCNADCKFCVAQLRYEHRNLLYKKDKLSDSEYLARLEKVLTAIRPLNPSISITGGEPSMSKKLVPILEIVDGLGFRKRAITTNGSHLLDMINGDTVIEHLIKHHWDHLNISRTSPSDELNQVIMRYNSSEGYCDNRMLKTILDISNNSPMKHRLSCLLLKDSVNSVEKIKEYVDYYIGLGANNFIFRELMDYDATAVNQEKIDYCTNNKVRLNDIWEDFKNYPELVPYMNILGYYYYVEIYKYKNAVIASESADLNQQSKEFEAHPDTIYEMVFHPRPAKISVWMKYHFIYCIGMSFKLFGLLI